MNKLQALLTEQSFLIADGGLGSMLMAAGLTQGASPEAWNIDHPERVAEVHRAYIEAGSQIILTNTFGGTRFRLKLHDLQDQAHALNLAAAKIARTAADAASSPVVVAGSMGPTGEILAPLGELAFEDAKAGFAEQAAALAEGGVDVLWIETMSDLSEVRAAAEGAKSVSDLPLVITMTFDTNGHTMMGVSPRKALEALREFEPLALGANCGNGPDEIEAVVRGMYAVDQAMPLVAKSNAGIPQLINGEPVYTAGPAEMVDYALKARNLGATIIGACCGSTPDHIRAMHAALHANGIAREAPTPLTDSPARPTRTRTRRRSRA